MVVSLWKKQIFKNEINLSKIFFWTSRAANAQMMRHAKRPNNSMQKSIWIKPFVKDTQFLRRKCRIDIILDHSTSLHTTLTTQNWSFETCAKPESTTSIRNSKNAVGIASASKSDGSTTRKIQQQRTICANWKPN